MGLVGLEGVLGFDGGGGSGEKLAGPLKGGGGVSLGKWKVLRDMFDFAIFAAVFGGWLIAREVFAARFWRVVFSEGRRKDRCLRGGKYIVDNVDNNLPRV